MGKKLPGVLMFLLVILKVSAASAASCTSSCSSNSCHCSNLGLTSVPQDLPTHIIVFELDLGFNQITNLSQSDFSRYRNLRTLNLNNNRISNINSQAFYVLSLLTTLRLDSNRIRSLRYDLFTGLGNLQELYLSDNEINDIQAGAFSSTSQIRYLYMHENKLTILRADFFTGLASMSHLTLYNNTIRNIQAGTFSPTPQLRGLRLDYNKLTNLRSDMFTGLGNLQEVHLYNNEISYIQAGTFSSTPRLGRLYLSNNNITTFPFNDLSTLRLDLELDNNRLTTISSTAYDVLMSMSYVKIYNNPWLCDCRMVDFRLRMTGFYPFEDQINCTQPDHLYGQKLKDINPENLFSDCVEPTIVRFQRATKNTVVQGETLQLVCEASGIPTPDITVTLPSGMNASTYIDRRVTVSKNGTITVRDITAADTGLYVCIAANSVGATNAILHVDVTYKEPTIVRFEMNDCNNSILKGEALCLICEASGIPTPEITVLLPSGLNTTVDSDRRVTVSKNGTITVRYITTADTVTLPSGLNTTVESGGRVILGLDGTIIVRNVTAADSGLYVCVAASLVGFTFATLVVDLSTVPGNKTVSPTFSLPVLIGAICGSVAGTLLTFGIILAIWCRKKNNSPSERPDQRVVFNNTNDTAVITSVQAEPMLPQGFQYPQHFSESAASLPEEYETMAPLHGGTDERPPLPIPSRSADGYQSLRQTDAESADDYETPHDYLSIIET